MLLRGGMAEGERLGGPCAAGGWGRGQQGPEGPHALSSSLAPCSPPWVARLELHEGIFFPALPSLCQPEGLAGNLHSSCTGRVGPGARLSCPYVLLLLLSPWGWLGWAGVPTLPP